MHLSIFMHPTFLKLRAASLFDRGAGLQAAARLRCVAGRVKRQRPDHNCVGEIIAGAQSGSTLNPSIHPREEGGEDMKPAEQQRLLDDVEAFCEEIRPIEELCYVEHTFNKEVLSLGRKYNLLGMIVPGEYGGRGADTTTYLRA